MELDVECEFDDNEGLPGVSFDKRFKSINVTKSV